MSILGMCPLIQLSVRPSVRPSYHPSVCLSVSKNGHNSWTVSIPRNTLILFSHKLIQIRSRQWACPMPLFFIRTTPRTKGQKLKYGNCHKTSTVKDILIKNCIHITIYNIKEKKKKEKQLAVCTDRGNAEAEHVTVKMAVTFEPSGIVWSFVLHQNWYRQHQIGYILSVSMCVLKITKYIYGSRGMAIFANRQRTDRLISRLQSTSESQP